MFDSILVPLDFSEMDTQSLEQTAYMARPQTRVTLLHVIERIEHLDEEEDQDFYDRIEKLVARKMAGRVRQAEALGLTIRGEMVYGKKVAEILGFARDNGTDLIVMGSSRIQWEKPVRGFDSTSHSIAMLSQCPVFLVKC